MKKLAPDLPLVLQLGFAGSRFLLDPEQYPTVDVERFEAEVCQKMVAMLRDLPQELGLSSHHFVCGISSLAIGADMAFTRACQGVRIGA